MAITKKNYLAEFGSSYIVNKNKNKKKTTKKMNFTTYNYFTKKL